MGAGTSSAAAPPAHGLQHRRFPVQKAFRLKEGADLAHDRDPFLEHGARMLVRHQVEIALAIRASTP